MKCKICGKEMKLNQIGFSFGVKARCQCGKIRSRERIKGCPKCGIHATHKNPVMQLYIKKGLFGAHYEMHCENCGHKWRVQAQ